MAETLITPQTMLMPQKAGSVVESFGRRLQKASGLQGHSARNWQLRTVRQNVGGAAGIKQNGNDLPDEKLS